MGSCPRIPCVFTCCNETTCPCFSFMLHCRLEPHGKNGPAGPVCLCEVVVRDPIHSRRFPPPCECSFLSRTPFISQITANRSTACLTFLLNFCKASIQTAECSLCKNHGPCGTGVFDFCKVAIGGVIAILQNFTFQERGGSSRPHTPRPGLRLDTLPSRTWLQ